MSWIPPSHGDALAHLIAPPSLLPMTPPLRQMVAWMPSVFFGQQQRAAGGAQHGGLGEIPHHACFRSRLTSYWDGQGAYASKRPVEADASRRPLRRSRG